MVTFIPFLFENASFIPMLVTFIYSFMDNIIILEEPVKRENTLSY